MTCHQADAGGNFKTRHTLPKKGISALNQAVVEFMLARKSVPIQDLHEPGPTEDQIHTMLKAASRVPDHGRLQPWRFILYRGEARVRVGEMLAALAEEREGPLADARRQQELVRFSRAPLVIGVVCVPRDNPKIPKEEMVVSAGMVAMNLMIAATALGFGTNMITNWYAGIAEGRRVLGLEPHEIAIGFVHLGTAAAEAPERPRPDVSALVSDYSGPAGVD